MASFYLDNEEEEIKDIPDDFKQLFLSTWKVATACVGSLTFCIIS